MLHNAIKDHAHKGCARTRKAKVWQALDELFSLCDKKLWEEEFCIQLKGALSKSGQAMTIGWSKNNIRYYMVS